MEQTMDQAAAQSVTIVLAGEYDLGNVVELSRQLVGIEAADRVRIDLAAVDFLDCEALAALIAAVRVAQDCGTVVELQGVRPVIRRMLEVSGLAAVVRVSAAA